MRILILTSGYPSNFVKNQGIFVRTQSEILVQHSRHQVDVLAVVPISIKWVLKAKRFNFRIVRSEFDGIKSYFKPFVNIPKLNTYRMFRLAYEAKKIFLREIGKADLPDIVHVHGYQAGFLALWLKENYSIPFVITEHSSQFIDELVTPQFEVFARKVFLNANKCIAVSPHFAELMTLKIGCPFEVIPNVVQTELFVPTTKVEGNSIFHFFTAGGLVEEKNHLLLLESVYHLKQKGYHFRLRIGGEGALLKILREKCTELDILDCVAFIGLLSKEEMISEMQRMDAFVLSSRVETFGVVIIEALSCGRPVISTKSHGPVSILQSDELGILCEQTAESLCGAMEKMILNQKSYSTEKIRSYAEARYSGKVVAEQLTGLYTKIIEQRTKIKTD